MSSCSPSVTVLAEARRHAVASAVSKAQSCVEATELTNAAELRSRADLWAGETGRAADHVVEVGAGEMARATNMADAVELSTVELKAIKSTSAVAYSTELWAGKSASAVAETVELRAGELRCTKAETADTAELWATDINEAWLSELSCLRCGELRSGELSIEIELTELAELWGLSNSLLAESEVIETELWGTKLRGTELRSIKATLEGCWSAHLRNIELRSTKVNAVIELTEANVESTKVLNTWDSTELAETWGLWEDA